MNDNTVLTVLNALVNENYSVELFHNEYGYGAALCSWIHGEDDGTWVHDVHPFPTITEALVALADTVKRGG